MAPTKAKLAKRLDVISVSPTLAVMMEAKALKAKGVDVVDFGPGEPDFDTPQNVKQAGQAAIERNLAHYTHTSGIVQPPPGPSARLPGRPRAPPGPEDRVRCCRAPS